ncbi:MAG: pilus assembly protein PilM [Actinomycetota bacterium]|nr:pilus assembly protein PilM [Actinomycetota bacterium]
MFEAGLDLSSNKISLSAFVKKGNNLFLRNCAFMEVERHAIEASEIIDSVVIVNALKELWKKNKIKNKTVNVGISDTKIVLKEIEVPLTDEKEIDNAIKYQIGDYVPIAKDNLNYDYYIIEKNENSSKLMIVGVMKGIINNIISVLKSAGLKINAIEANCFPLYRLADYYLDFKNRYKENEENSDCIVYLGNDISIIEFTNKAELRYPRFINSSISLFKNNLSKKLSVSSEEANKILNDFDMDTLASRDLSKKTKIIPEAVENTGIDSVEQKNDGEPVKSIDKDNIIKDSMKISANQLINEITRSIEHFLQENRGFNINEIMLCGENLKNLEGYVANNLKYNLKRIDLTSKFLPDILKKNSLFKDNKNHIIPDSILLSCGLALRGIKN